MRDLPKLGNINLALGHMKTLLRINKAPAEGLPEAQKGFPEGSQSTKRFQTARRLYGHQGAAVMWRMRFQLNQNAKILLIGEAAVSLRQYVLIAATFVTRGTLLIVATHRDARI